MNKKVLGTAAASTLLVFALLTSGLAVEPGDDYSPDGYRPGPLPLSSIRFFSSYDWYLADGLPGQKSKDSLVFRKYFVYVVDGELDPDRGLANAVFLMCQRKYLDALVIHVPDGIELRSLERNQWISKLDLRTLADDVGHRFEGEYIKGDFFVDFTRQSVDGLQQILESKAILFEFGSGEERMNLYQDNDFRSLLQEVVPLAVKSMGGRNLRVFDGISKVLTACANFKAGRRSTK